MKLSTFHWFLKQLWICIIVANLWSVTTLAAEESETRTVRIGVLAKRGREQCLDKWSATAKYLESQLPNYHFEIIPLAFEEIVQAVNAHAVDFVLSNSSFYIDLEVNSRIQRIATLNNKHMDGSFHRIFSAVIFCRADRADIQGIESLKNMRFMAVNERSFGGWQMAWRELDSFGIDPLKYFDSLEFGGTHDDVVYAVRNGLVDAGTVRSDTLERMAQEQKIALMDFKLVLHPKDPDPHFNFLHSTVYYPEWPFAKCFHTSDQLATEVALALIAMPIDSEAAIQAHCAGWSIPQNYQPVRDCLMQLNLPPYETYGKVTLIDFWKQYRPWIVGLALIGFTMLLSLDRMMRFRAALRRSQDRIESNRQIDAANAASQAKSLFLANMSHEIRTPMNAVLGFAEILQTREKDPKLLRYVDAIYNSGHALLGLINDILDISKVEAGKLELQFGTVSLHQLADELHMIFSQKMAEKGLRFSMDLATDLPKAVILDEVRLRQVLINLIGNALKFTEHGYVRVLISCNFIENTHSELALEIKVSDTGKGIAPDQHELIFGAFEQTKGQKVKEYGGTGLGLAISRRLVEMMQGSLTVESSLGDGATFIINLPNVEVAAGIVEEKEAALEIDQVLFKPAKVLVVDDVDYNREILCTYLSEQPFECFEAKNGLIAIEQAKKHHPDIILMDIKMPVMDGFEAAGEMRKNKQLRHTPIIAVTASVLKEDKHLIVERCDSFLGKPIRKTELFAELMKYLPYSKLEHVSQPEQESKLEENTQCSTVDMFNETSDLKGKLLLVEDNPINQELALELLNSLPVTILVANDGKEAIELVKQHDFNLVLMDLKMPTMGGLEASNEIRKLDQSNVEHLPIFAMTADSWDEVKESCIKAGMNGCITKPFAPDDLYALVKKYM